MINVKAQRTQVDGKQQEYSKRSAIAITGEGARQEFKDEADVNKILQRFGVTAPQRQVIYESVDYDLDLQTAHIAIDQAKEMHQKLPRDLREKYPTWQAILNAIHNGSLKIDLDQAEANAEMIASKITKAQKAEQELEAKKEAKKQETRESPKVDTR